jgi:hypothetical protein
MSFLGSELYKIKFLFPDDGEGGGSWGDGGDIETCRGKIILYHTRFVRASNWVFHNSEYIT